VKSGALNPDLVEQQMWGLLLAHCAIRALLLDAADPPARP
jgi:hypothetical protein